MFTNSRWVLSVAVVHILHEGLIVLGGEVGSETIDQVGTCKRSENNSWSVQATAQNVRNSFTIRLGLVVVGS